jgi:hypothetical protein
VINPTPGSAFSEWPEMPLLPACVGLSSGLTMMLVMLGYPRAFRFSPFVAAPLPGTLQYAGLRYKRSSGKHITTENILPVVL